MERKETTFSGLKLPELIQFLELATQRFEPLKDDLHQIREATTKPSLTTTEADQIADKLEAATAKFRLMAAGINYVMSMDEGYLSALRLLTELKYIQRFGEDYATIPPLSSLNEN
jgi:hypothetical protein